MIFYIDLAKAKLVDFILIMAIKEIAKDRLYKIRAKSRYQPYFKAQLKTYAVLWKPLQETKNI